MLHLVNTYRRTVSKHKKQDSAEMCISCRASANKRTKEEQEAFENVLNAEEQLRLAKEKQENLKKEEGKQTEDEELALAFGDIAKRTKKSRAEDAEMAYPRLAKELRDALEFSLMNPVRELVIILPLTHYSPRIRKELYERMDSTELHLLRCWSHRLMDDQKDVTWKNEAGDATHIYLRFGY